MGKVGPFYLMLVFECALIYLRVLSVLVEVLGFEPMGEAIELISFMVGGASAKQASKQAEA
ncbi:hypothetical protein CFREI_08395 [Corynebacterium freiburgense]|nr:hypothetical protein CFREI_08395 [Corynebacterium freiburgense]